MNDTQKLASLIVDTLFVEAQKIKGKRISGMEEMGIAAVLTGLTSFFVAGYRNDSDLCLELTPAFQKRIMPATTKKEYDDLTFTMNDSYTHFRETAIEYQGGSDDWETQMIVEFSEMLIVMIRADATDEIRNLMIEEIKEILRIATETVNDKSGEADKDRTSNKKSGSESKWKKVVKAIVVIFVIGICALYFYITQVQISYAPQSALYHMRDYYDDNIGYIDCYIKITPGDGDKENLGTFSIYMIDKITGSDDRMPYQCILTTAKCGYWKWKKLVGSLAVSDDGRKFDVIPRGFTRVDCYMSGVGAVGFDMFTEPIDIEDNLVLSGRDTLDFGTNNFIYEGTLYSQVSENEIDRDTAFFMDMLDERMEEKENGLVDAMNKGSDYSCPYEFYDINGFVYTSRALGIRWMIPNSNSHNTQLIRQKEDQIAELNGIEYTSLDDYRLQLVNNVKKHQRQMEFWVSDPSGTNSLSVSVYYPYYKKELDLSKISKDSMFTEEYKDTLMDQFEANSISVAEAKTSFCGYSAKRFSAILELDDSHRVYYTMLVFVTDEYAGYLTMYSFDDDKSSDYIDVFEKVE